MSVSRVIYIVDSPLSTRDAERFGIDRLIRHHLDVEVWHVGALYYKLHEAQVIEDPTTHKVLRLTSEAVLTAKLGALGQSDVVVLIAGIQPLRDRTLKAFRMALARTQATICAVHSGLVADDTTAMLSRFSFAKRFYLRVKHLANKARHMWFRIWWSDLWGTSRRVEHGLPLIDIAWVSTSPRAIDPLLLGRRTSIRPIHSFDYDRLLEALPDNLLPSGGIVVIDTMGPLNPDFSMNGVHVPNLDADRYYETLREFLSRIHHLSGLPVVVAAHPRSPRGLIEPYYDHSRMVYGKTIPLVRDASVCVAMGGSTVLGMIATLRKPLILATSASFGPIDNRLVRRNARLLGLKTWNIDRPVTNFSVPQVNTKKYESFSRRFVKLPGSPDGLFWDIVARDLLEL